MANVMPKDVALEEFARWCDLMDLEHKFEESDMDEDDRAAASKLRRTIVRAIQKGCLQVDDDGVATFSPEKGDTSDIRFGEPTGADIQAMDRRKEKEVVGKMQAVLASWTGQNAKRFAQMSNRDFAVCQALFSAFFS